MPQNNQHNSLAPDVLDREVLRLFNEGKTDVTIAECILESTGFGPSTKTIQRSRKRQNLLNTWNAKLTPADITDDFEELRTIYPDAGAVRMKGFMLVRKGLHVPRAVINQHMRDVEPEATTARKGKRIQRRQQYIAGVNVTWTMDQHDKWQKYGLLLHVGLDICSGYILWAKVWWNNRNPNLICKYYLDAVDSTGGIPLVTQSDGGSENFNIAKAQTAMRQAQDPALVGSIQHRWMGHRFNTPPETFWSGMRTSWSPGFERVFEYGVSEGLYDSNNLLQQMIFRWLAVPWMQKELDVYRTTLNLTKKRHDKRKILPQGRPPKDIFTMPSASGVLDFKVNVDDANRVAARQQYAPPEHPVFKLVSDDFDAAMNFLMRDLGFPDVNILSFWNIYCELLALVVALGLDMDAIGAREVALEDNFREQESDLLAAARTADPAFGTEDWNGQVGRLNVGTLPVVLEEDTQGLDDDSESGTEVEDRGQEAFVDEEGRVWLPGLRAMLAEDGVL